jgi:DNA mismatch repair protein MutS2
MARSAEEALEFDRLLLLLRGSTTCEPGRRRIAALTPLRDRTALEESFALIREAMEWLRGGAEMGFGALADPHAWLAKLGVPGSVLSPHELLDAVSLAETCAWLRQALAADREKFPLLAERGRLLGDFRALAQAIRRAVLPNGDISDDASPGLKRIRASMARTRETLQRRLKAILESRGAAAGEDYFTLRNDRFVIPVRAADRRSVPGVVHGASATGQTVFIEPLETLDLNNQLVQLAEDEAAEIARILSELTGRLREAHAPLEAAADGIALVDSVFARARYARAFDCALPEFASDAAGIARISLDEARHPLLEEKLRAAGGKVVPISLSLGEGETVLVISGPNTGGKTVALKTVGLAALAAQSGIPVPASRAVLSVFDRVLVDIGDEQSIAADLSTFSAHMLNLRAMLEAATPRSLVLVDEMGTGTAPEEGAALAVALLEEFRARGCLTLATTHHDRLKTYASTTPGILNAAVEFDAVNLRPTYRLLTGVPGVSSGIQIALRLGLPPRVIERARREIAPEARQAGELIAWLHRSRDELEAMKRETSAELARLEEERRALQTEWAGRQRRRLAELEQRFAETLRQHEEQLARALSQAQDRELRARLEKQGARLAARAKSAAREQADAAVLQHLSESQADLGPAAAPVLEQPVSPQALVAGAQVRVRGFGQPVLLRQHDGRSAEVQAGPLRMKVRAEDILAVVGSPADAGGAATPAAQISRRPHDRGITVRRHGDEGQSAAGRSAALDEINVIGRTVEEACQLVDKFLDNAALEGKSRVRIIHGHGTGALRRGLAAFLDGHPLVERHGAEDAERGGAAITVVELKP